MEETPKNFRGYIAFPLEVVARRVLKLEEGEYRGTIFEADSIEGGTFVEVMLFLLRTELGYEADLSEFISIAGMYLGKPANEMDFKKAEELFAKFEDKIAER